MSDNAPNIPETIPQDPAELRSRLEQAEARAREARSEADRYRQVFAIPTSIPLNAPEPSVEVDQRKGC